MRNEEWLTGGTLGINNIARPSVFGFSLEGNLVYYYFVLALAVAMSALLGGLLRSPWGKAGVTPAWWAVFNIAERPQPQPEVWQEGIACGD